jgi:hypothetical protein
MPSTSCRFSCRKSLTVTFGDGQWIRGKGQDVASFHYRVNVFEHTTSHKWSVRRRSAFILPRIKQNGLFTIARTTIPPLTDRNCFCCRLTFRYRDFRNFAMKLTTALDTVGHSRSVAPGLMDDFPGRYPSGLHNLIAASRKAGLEQFLDKVLQWIKPGALPESQSQAVAHLLGQFLRVRTQAWEINQVTCTKNNLVWTALPHLLPSHFSRNVRVRPPVLQPPPPSHFSMAFVAALTRVFFYYNRIACF